MFEHVCLVNLSFCFVWITIVIMFNLECNWGQGLGALVTIELIILYYLNKIKSKMRQIEVPLYILKSYLKLKHNFYILKIIKPPK